MKGRSAAEGRLILTNRFWVCGIERHFLFRTRTSEYITFHPWLVRVRAAGFADYVAPLGDMKGPPDWHETDEPLGLMYPLRGPVTIALRTAIRQGKR